MPNRLYARLCHAFSGLFFFGGGGKLVAVWVMSICSPSKHKNLMLTFYPPEFNLDTTSQMTLTFQIWITFKVFLLLVYLLKFSWTDVNANCLQKYILPNFGELYLIFRFCRNCNTVWKAYIHIWYFCDCWTQLYESWIAFFYLLLTLRSEWLFAWSECKSISNNYYQWV